MDVVNESWSFEDLTFEFQFDYEKTREEWLAYSAKNDLLHEMLMDCYNKKDFESEIVMFVERKRDVIRQQQDKFYDIQKYLGNLKDGYHFNVRRSVGRTMRKFGLTVDQAEMFKEVHRKHLAAFERESDAWKKRTIGHVEKVVWIPEEDCLHVHYDDGEWWHYDRNGEWY